VSRLSEIESRARDLRLYCAGIASVEPGDGLQPDIQSVLLLGPHEPEFWPWFQTQTEAGDGEPDALDRWSRRAIGRLACDLGAKAVFPFGGPPYRPFIRWAERSGRAFPSPVGMLVHDRAGLFFSLRGAIALRERLEPLLAANPCLTCTGQRCRTACPANALTNRGYDVRACHSFLDTGPGQDCMVGGCHVRRACPVGQKLRMADQSAFHMKAFHPR
jgi:epoxyqueuosine reductase